MENPPSQAWIFISYYRNEYGHWVAAKIASELEKFSGHGSVFYDSGSIKPGEEWRKTIFQALSECRVLVVVIEKNWPPNKIHNHDDWVRQEIRTALETRKFVIPLLLDGAKMPSKNDLPNDIAELVQRQSFFIDSRSEEVLKTSMSFMASTLTKMASCELVIVRNAQWWWERMESNRWSIYIDGKNTLDISGKETSKSIQLFTGKHTLQISWSEGQIPRHFRGETDLGYHSRGETEAIEVILHPGKNIFRLVNSGPDPRNWLVKFLSGQEDAAPRAIRLVDPSERDHT